jgi:putative toxin-antitoxin system antitoxin component (TIGR02293 family)
MTVSQAIDNLGGVEVFGADVHSEIEFVERIEQGLPVRAADALLELGDLSEADLDEVVPRRTLSHARKRGRFSAEQSDRIVRAARIYSRAHEVFGDREKANRWMRRPNRVLEGKTPLSLLRTSSGSELVEAILDRIAYGVYS